MNQTVVLLNEYGTDLSSRATGTSVREAIFALAKTQSRVVVDCSEIRTLSESFADEVFGILVAEQGKPWFKDHISVVGLSEDTRNAILRAVAERLSVASGG
jgi:hypothetical protein